jgi:histidyl-tRNA synthetase
MAGKRELRALSGFPEWSPAQCLVEQIITARLREMFERFGFLPLSTRSVEPVELLLGQGGDADKEIYGLVRLAASDDERGAEPLGLRFDLTVPLARYTVQQRGELLFPFKRYQIQTVWRGERPQRGRYREFVQADLDVVSDGVLPTSYDSELPRLLLTTLDALPLPAVKLRINHRKLMEGAFRSLGVSDVQSVLRTVDKLDKVGAEQVASTLGGLGLAPNVTEQILALGRIRVADSKALCQALAPFRFEHPDFEQGLAELCAILDSLASLPATAEQRLLADLSVARGLDYYTGVVYEGQLVGFEQELGAVCSGGRYDNLAASLSGDRRTQLPGVGVSIGLTRLLGFCFDRGLLAPTRPTPLCVVVALASERDRPAADAVAWSLRARGIAADVHPTAVKFGKQIRNVDRAGVPYIWFLADDERPARVKDVRSGDEQVAVDPDTWDPPVADRAVGLVARTASL